MRLFIGVELDEQVKAAAAAAASRLRERLRKAAPGLDARWIAPENLHITVWFIGEVADAKSEAIVDALRRPALATPAFELQIAGCGAFPPAGGPRVFWIGVREGMTEMRRLYGEIAARLMPLGFEPERREYTPHLTFARVKQPPRGSARLVRPILDAVAAQCGVSRVSHVTVFRSRLSPKGATYEPVHRVPLL